MAKTGDEKDERGTEDVRGIGPGGAKGKGVRFVLDKDADPEELADQIREFARQAKDEAEGE